MELRGVRVHNLQGIDVTIPWGKLVAISGVSGSGKSSLAFDTLYAEGQRRYLESLSPGSRRLLEQMPLPEADHIDPLPAAIAVRQNARVFPPRSTLASATELSHYLQLLFAKVGTVICPDCEEPVRKHSPQDVLETIHSLPSGRKYMIAFPITPSTGESDTGSLPTEELIERGFARVIWNHATINLLSDEVTPDDLEHAPMVLVDRLTSGKNADERVIDSLEQAFSAGEGRCVLLCEENASSDSFLVDENAWRIERFSDEFVCEVCGRLFLEPEPRLFNPQSPAGACETCQGSGIEQRFSLEELVPDPRLPLRQGAMACFKEPILSGQESDWLESARKAGIALDQPFEKLRSDQRKTLAEGDSESGFAGIEFLFAELQQSTKPTTRVFLERWLVQKTCAQCQGSKLRSEALAVRIGNQNYDQVSGKTVAEFQGWINELPGNLSKTQQFLMSVVLFELQSRTDSLVDLGLDYLSLDSSTAELSSGELQRIALARTAGQQLAGSMSIFDEPSTGLHPADCEQVAKVLARLREPDNTVIVVEHESDFLQAADYLIDLGPGGGSEGGRVVFQGSPDKLTDAAESLTAGYLTGRKTVARAQQGKNVQGESWLTIEGVNCFPFHNVSFRIPLSGLCVLTGVSGSGKSVLLEKVLSPAIEHALGKPIPRSVRERFGDLAGQAAIENVVLLDQTPPGGHSRSNPATYLNFFDDIRRVFAETPDAQKQGFQLKDFSFNSPAGGRCPHCAGQGVVNVEMQFLADLEMTCPECGGTRYRSEILSARYRGLNIAEVLNLTVSEAFSFFRTSPRIRKRLQVLLDVGLGYLSLGQATGTLSGGESQRLKLAEFLCESHRGRTLFLLDEPTCGLHPADIQTLLNCFDQLLAVGHSIVVAEHNLHFINQADWVIDLGPGAAESGGQILAAGSPKEIGEARNSITGRFLKKWRRPAQPDEDEITG